MYVVAVWGVAMWGICGVGVLRYGELLLVGVTGWESSSVGELWCGRVAVCVNCCVWQLQCAVIAAFGQWRTEALCSGTSKLNLCLTK